MFPGLPIFTELTLKTIPTEDLYRLEENGIKTVYIPYPENITQFENIYNQVKTIGDKGISVTDEDLKSIVITELTTTGKEYIKLLAYRCSLRRFAIQTLFI